MKPIFIGDREISMDQPAFIIAEISANHLHDHNHTMELVKEAAGTGADAIKIQTLTPDSMTIDCDLPPFIIQHECPWKGQKLYDLYSETPLPYEWHQEIFDICSSLGVICFSTPYDSSSLEFLSQFDPPAYKIASFEIVDIPLIKKVARLGKPVIFSTGIASESEIKLAVETCRKEGNDQIAVLKCTSGYPAPFSDLNLNLIPRIANDFQVTVGLSDHTLGSQVPIVARALGGVIIEKHITRRRSDGGPDADFSMEVDEFRDMVEKVRSTEEALGVASYQPSGSSVSGRIFSRSIFAVEDIEAGDPLTEKNCRIIRPGSGLPPKHFEEVLSRKAKTSIRRGTPLSWELIG